MIFYVAGPMRGYPRFNYDEFKRTTGELRNLGHVVICPAESFGGSPELNGVLTVADFARYDLHAILQVEAICLLEGWNRSIGACTEVTVGRWLNLPFYRFTEYGVLVQFFPDNPAEVFTQHVTAKSV